jgi:diaminopimelate decarboxylase
MNDFEIRNGEMFCEGLALSAIADEVGTPVYVYSTASMRRQARALQEALAHLADPLIAYAVKANPNSAVIATFAAAGLGADVVSGGEYRRALKAGVPPSRIVFSGVGKTADEMRLALETGLFQFNVESFEEAEMLSAVATEMGRVAPMGFRVNPDVPAGGHAKITTGSAENKFGIAISEAPGAYRRAAALPGLKVQGVAVHIGSQLTDLAPLERAFTRVGELLASLRGAGHGIIVADLGGGLGVAYDPSQPTPASPADYGAMVCRVTRDWNARLVFEPGRLMVGNAGVLLSRVIRVKPGATDPFVIVDAAMNDLMRPTLYDAWHNIEAVRPRGTRQRSNVVGPVCETGDTFATGRDMDAVGPDDLVVFRTAGAYAAAMAGTYNTRALTPEVLVDGDRWALIRKRLEVEALIAGDLMPDWLGGCAAEAKG